MLVHENAVVRIHPDMPLDRAALIGCAVSTGLGAVFRTAKVEPGSTVAVVGCGGIGLNCMQGAVLADASRVVAVDTNARKLEWAKQFGATDLVDASTTDPVEEVRCLFPGSGPYPGGVEHVFDAVGLKQTVEQAFALLRTGGTCAVTGIVSPETPVAIQGYELLNEKKLQGSRIGSNRFRQDMPRYVELYLQGRLKLDELISALLGFDQIDDGFAAMYRGETARF